MAPKHAPDDPRARTVDRVLTRLGAIVTGVVYPLVAAAVLAFVIASLPDLLRAARDEGIPGTFTVVSKECRPRWEKNGGCETFGDFTSDDGTVRLADVLFEKNPGEPGTQVPAQYVPADDPPMIYAKGSDEWRFAVVMGFGAVGYLGYRGWRLVRRRPTVTSAEDE